MSYDLLIKDARVVDGSGLPAYGADVGIREGRIAEIGRLSKAPPHHRRRRAGAGAGIHRPPHALGCPPVLGSVRALLA